MYIVEFVTIGLLLALLALQIYRIIQGMSRAELQENLDDLAGALESMGIIFQNLDQLMPSYTIEANPIAGAIQKALMAWFGVDDKLASDLLTDTPPRNPEGRFDAATEEAEETD